MFAVRIVTSILILFNLFRIGWYLLSDDIVAKISMKKDERSQDLENCNKRMNEIGTILGMRKMWTYKKLLRGRRIRLTKEREEAMKKMNQLDWAHTKMEAYVSKKSDAIISSAIFIAVVILIYVQICLKL